MRFVFALGRDTKSTNVLLPEGGVDWLVSYFYKDDVIRMAFEAKKNHEVHIRSNSKQRVRKM